MIKLPNIKQEVDFLLSGTPRRNTVPILSGVAIETLKDGVRMRTTDLETTCYTLFAKREPSKGVNGVARITKKLVQKENKLLMRHSNDSTQIFWNDVPVISESLDEFPSYPFDGRQKRIKLPFSDLMPILDKAVKFCSTDELKPAQNGVYIGREHSKTLIAATDGHILFIYSSYIPSMPKMEIIVPRGSIHKLKKLRKLSDNLTFELIGKEHSHLHVKNDVAGLVSRLIDERFPDVEAVIPMKYNHTCRGKTEVWLNTLRYIKDVAPIDETRLIALKSRKCYTENCNTGLTHTFAIPITVPLKIGFNIDYLLSVFRSIDTEKFTWKFTHPHGTSTIIPEKSGERYLIMPMRIRQEEED